MKTLPSLDKLQQAAVDTKDRWRSIVHPENFYLAIKSGERGSVLVEAMAEVLKQNGIDELPWYPSQWTQYDAPPAQDPQKGFAMELAHLQADVMIAIEGYGPTTGTGFAVANRLAHGLPTLICRRPRSSGSVVNAGYFHQSVGQYCDLWVCDTDRELLETVVDRVEALWHQGKLS